MSRIIKDTKVSMVQHLTIEYRQILFAYDVRRGRGRPKLTWGEAIKRDLKAWDT